MGHNCGLRHMRLHNLHKHADWQHYVLWNEGQPQDHRGTERIPRPLFRVIHVTKVVSYSLIRDEMLHCGLFLGHLMVVEEMMHTKVLQFV